MYRRLIAPLSLTALLLTACGESTLGPADTGAERTATAGAQAGTPTGTAGTGSTGSTSGASAPTRTVTTDEDYDCTTSVTGTFQNVFVPAGASCTLIGATVKGNILARERSRLFVYETTTAGNIDGVEAAVVHVRGGRLGGSIQAQDGVSGGETGVRIFGGTVLTQGNITIQKMRTGTISITDVQLLKGNIQLQENVTGTRLEVLRNRVAQNLEVFVNSGAGAKAVQTNTVGQKLSCKDNTGPFTGRPNTAGDVEGQCGR